MAAESPYKVGMLVRNTRFPRWGPGKILAIDGLTVTVYFRDLQEEIRPFARASAIRTSAATGQGVHRLGPLLLDLRRRWSLRAPTATVNEVIHRAQAERPTPRSAGTLHYATQVSSGPPLFVLFGGANEPDAGYRRYLENRLRGDLGLEGVPIRLRFRPRTRGGRSSRSREARAS